MELSNPVLKNNASTSLSRTPTLQEVVDPCTNTADSSCTESSPSPAPLGLSHTKLETQVQRALTVAENVMGGSSPSLRRISVKTPDQEKGLINKFKKKSDPVMVFSFSPEETQGQGGGCKIDGDSSGIFNLEDIGSIPKSLFEKNEKAESVISKKYSTPNTLGVERARRPSIHSSYSVSSISRLSTHHQDVKEVKMAKQQRFWDFLTMVLSIAYGLFIIVGSVASYASDLVMSFSYRVNVGEMWNLYLCSVGILLLIFLSYDIHRYIGAVMDLHRGSNNRDIRLVEGEDGELHIEVPMETGNKKKVPEYYGFTTGRHSGSFFLKIGAAAFCFGHTIHMAMNLVKHIYTMEDEELKEKYCGQIEGLIYDIVHPVFSLVQLYFIFKYGNVIVNKNRWLARFTFSHCMSSCISFWMNTLMNETLDAIVLKYFPVRPLDPDDDRMSTSTISTTTQDDDDDLDIFRVQPTVSLHDKYDWTSCERNGSGIENNLRCVIETRAKCNNEESANTIFSVANYLYPFSIEFNILVVAIWYILWSGIGKITDHKDTLEFLPSVTPQGSMEDLQRMEGHRQAQILFADCSHSNLGMFTGIVMVIAVVVCSIVILTMEGGSDYSDTILFGNLLRIVAMGLLILSSIYGYYIVAGLDVNPSPISLLDDLLLFLCLPSFFMYFIVWTAPLIQRPDAASLVANFLTILQVLIQTPMIVDGLRRCSIDPHIEKRMPGRNAITFLIVANLAVYIMETMLIKSNDYQKTKTEFYGADGWTVLSHVTLPICIFYR